MVYFSSSASSFKLKMYKSYKEKMPVDLVGWLFISSEKPATYYNWKAHDAYDACERLTARFGPESIDHLFSGNDKGRKFPPLQLRNADRGDF